MTRINANIDPATLHRRHLVAELREITMVPAALKRALRTKTKDAILASIPKKFTLGTGHVRFFYDKQEFLRVRFHNLVREMKSRGYSPDVFRSNAFWDFDPEFRNDWQSSADDNALVQERINLRISQKPHLYKD